MSYAFDRYDEAAEQAAHNPDLWPVRRACDHCGERCRADGMVIPDGFEAYCDAECATAAEADQTTRLPVRDSVSVETMVAVIKGQR